jgi:eukaryotic-like serine/threonine-protein kinase
LIAGRYVLEELVGAGGMSSVYRAHDQLLERDVALKILHSSYREDEEAVERFRREAQAVARLSHPNVVTVIDRGEEDGHQFIVFEYVDGATLKDHLAKRGPLPPEEALAIAIEVGEALAYAHGHGIVHRDVKPQNVILNGSGSAKVTDFGIARSVDVEKDLTETGMVIGTGDYIAPEQASGQPVDARSDQYSLGVVLYELLTGEVPYPGDNAMAVAMRHLRDPVPSVRARRPGLSPRVDAIVARALAKKPRDRFPSVEAMAAALEAALAEEHGARGPDDEDTGTLPPPAPPPPRARRPRRPPRRSRTVVVALVLLGVLALVAGLVAARLGRDPLGSVVPGAGDQGDGAGGAVRLRALSDFDPEGDDREHPDEVALATDRDPATYWTTETYSSFSKSGVGIVLDAREPAALGRLVVVSDEPGFTARIRAGQRPRGPFEDVSDEQTVGERTAFELDSNGEEYRYYLIWITDPNGRAHVNEVRARAG